MANRERVVVKVGGSLLTHKRRPLSVNRRGMARVCQAFARCRNQLIIVHGGGSFGHFYAKHAGLGVEPAPADRARVADVHRSMLELNLVFLQSLLRHKVPAYPFAPGPTFQENRLVADGRGFLESLLAASLVPVTFGDVVAHRDGRSSILSGDVLVRQLAEALQPVRVVFALDVEGVFRIPGHPETLITRLEPDEVAEVPTAAGKIDVTGGLALKLRQARMIAKAGISVAFLGGNRPAEFLAALEGRPFQGTFMPGIHR